MFGCGVCIVIFVTRRSYIGAVMFGCGVCSVIVVTHRF